MTRAQKRLPVELSPDPYRRSVYASICAVGAGCSDWRAGIERLMAKLDAEHPHRREQHRQCLSEYMSHERELPCA